MGFVSFFENFLTIAVLLFAWIVVSRLLHSRHPDVHHDHRVQADDARRLHPGAVRPVGTAFLAERVLGNVISSGIKVMVLAVIVGIGSTLFAQFTAGFGSNQPTFGQAMALVLAALSAPPASVSSARESRRPRFPRGPNSAPCRRRSRHRRPVAAPSAEARDSRRWWADCRPGAILAEPAALQRSGANSTCLAAERVSAVARRVVRAVLEPASERVAVSVGTVGLARRTQPAPVPGRRDEARAERSSRLSPAPSPAALLIREGGGAAVNPTEERGR